MVESQEVSNPLCRDFVPELIRVVAQGGDDGGVTWNVVESLELLLDAGAFKDAFALATGVIEMLGDDRRNRLFKGYAELARIVEGRPYRECLDAIEALAIEIDHGGFSQNDRCWSAILLARALSIGVYTRVLPEAELFRARRLLSVEFAKGRDLLSVSTHIKVGLELARSYITCHVPEIPAANELLRSLLATANSAEVPSEVVFDVNRLLHQISGDEGCPADDLRSLAAPLGGVARGLAELTIGRREARLSEQGTRSLEKALALFEESSYRSGAFEALMCLGGSAAECEHHARAYRFFTRADRVSADGGFLYGRGVALLGLFHSAMASGDVENGEIAAEKLRILSSSDLFVSAFGLNSVAAHQVLGSFDVAKKLASQCEKLFVTQGAHALAAQAAFMLGACHAEAGKWKLARTAWKRALVCDELRRAYVSACDRRAALAQAIAMVDFSERGVLSDSTLREVERLRVQSEKALVPFGKSIEATQSLGRTLHVHAQLEILAKQPLNALRHLNRARECFGALGAERDVALTDGLTGLALLEASKKNGSQLIDEAMSALQRSLDFFAREGQVRITWKIRYYLTVACVIKSQQSSDGLQRESYRKMAIAFLEEATIESKACSSERGMPRSSTGEGDFSPGLKPEVLQPLGQVLGLATKRRKAKDAGDEDASSEARYGRYLH
jgi:tetratricopeptide (TPR) repeat protein